MDGYVRFRDALNAIQMIGASELRSLKSTLEARFGSLLNTAHLFAMCLNDPAPIDRYSLIRSVAAFIAFSVDQTGCGIHNQQVFDAANSVMDYLVYEEGFDWGKLDMHCTGYRARSFFLNRFRKSKLTCFVKVRKDRRGFLLSLVIDQVFYNPKASKHVFLFNRFQTAFKSSPTMYELVNYYAFINFLSYGDSTKANRNMGNVPVFCGSASRFGNVFNWYRYSYLSIISDCSDDNEYSSIGSKIISLMSAVKNTETILEEMKLVYNKLRQEVITTELLEFGLHVLLHENKKKAIDNLNHISNTFIDVLKSIRTRFCG
jgi:F0F1-type ATP synthase gamma subunit